MPAAGRVLEARVPLRPRPAPRRMLHWTLAWTMSSETSTERQPESLQPWQLFTLAGLIGATVVVFLSRGQTPAAIILLSCAIFAAAYVGATALRTVLPLAGTLRDDAGEAIGDRTRAALEREKTLRSEEHTSELQSQSNLVCRLLLEKKK